MNPRAGERGSTLRGALAFAGALVATGALFLCIPIANGALAFDRGGAGGALLEMVSVALDSPAEESKPKPQPAKSRAQDRSPPARAKSATANRYAAVETAPRVPSAAGLEAALPLRLRSTGVSGPPGELSLARDAGIASRAQVEAPKIDLKEFHEVDHPPRKIRALPPVYPPGLLSREIEGSATIYFIVGEDGHTRDVRVVSVDGPAEFGDAARAAVESWTFEPATNGGARVAVYAQQRIQFHLER